MGLVSRVGGPERVQVVIHHPLPPLRATWHASSTVQRGSPPASRELPADVRFSAVPPHVLGCASARKRTSRRPYGVQCGGVLG